MVVPPKMLRCTAKQCIDPRSSELVKLGARPVIGASSVITKDIPEGMLAVGNRCRVIREI
jgi:hypothetical protein